MTCRTATSWCCTPWSLTRPSGVGGLGRAFLAYYEGFALSHGCHSLRIDTNARNVNARAFYKKLGYWEVAAVPCAFNGIPGVNLVLREKRIGEDD